MFYTYILRSIDTGRYYIGSTHDIVKRLEKHNKGYVRSTKTYKPWVIVYKEEFVHLIDARKREFQIKSWKKRTAIEKLINSAPIV